MGPKIYWRAKSLKSPGLEAIYLSPSGSARNVSVWRGSLPTEPKVRSNQLCGISIRASTAKPTDEVDPPIEVESATWAPGGTLDWRVKERQPWMGRVRGPDGRQRWVRAADLRPAKDGSR